MTLSHETLFVAYRRHEGPCDSIKATESELYRLLTQLHLEIIDRKVQFEFTICFVEFKFRKQWKQFVYDCGGRLAVSNQLLEHPKRQGNGVDRNYRLGTWINNLFWL